MTHTQELNIVTPEIIKRWFAYEHINVLPVKRWWEILKTGHLHHLYISGSGPVNPLLEDLWFDLQQQYFDEFGVDDNFKIRLRKMKKLTELNLDYVISGDRFLLNHINQLEAELNQWGGEHEVSNYKMKGAIEMHRHYQIDLDKTTVIDWGHMVKDYDEAGRKAKAERTKQKMKGHGRK